MKKNWPPILFFLFFFSCPMLAQLHVVKDNVACLYGLKNESGAWVVPPSYILIQPGENGMFITEAGGGRGLINKEGLVLMPPMLESYFTIPEYNSFYITGSKRQYNASPNSHNPVIIARFKDSVVVVDSKGKIYLTAAHSTVSPDYGKHFIITDKSGKTRYTDSTGKIIFGPFQGNILPFGQRGYTAAGQYSNELFVSGKGSCGVIRMNGDTVIPCIYDRIGICGRYILATKNSLDAVFDTTGRELLPLQYALHSWDNYHSQGSCPGYQTMLISKNKKFGLLSGDLKVLIEPKYDKIEKTYSHGRATCYAWKTFLGKKMGVVDLNGRIVLEAVYDTVIAIPYPKVNEYQEPDLYRFIVRNNGKYGLAECNGTLSEPINHEVMITTSNEKNQPAILFFDGDSATAFYANAKAEKPRFISHISDSASVWVFSKRYFLLTGKGKSMRISSPYSENVLQIGNYLLIQYRNNYILLNADGTVKIPARSIASVAHNNASYFIFCTQNQNYGMLSASGEWLLDTVYKAIAFNTPTNEGYWVKRKNTIPANPKYPGACRGNWELVDSKNRNILPQKFSLPFTTDKNKIVASPDSLFGIYSIPDKKYIAEPRYRMLHQVSNHHYIAYTSDTAFILLDSNGVAISNTKWKTHQEIFNEILPATTPGMKQNTIRFFWLLSGEKGPAVYSSDGRFYTSRQQIDSLCAFSLFSWAWAKKDGKIYDPVNNNMDTLFVNTGAKFLHEHLIHFTGIVWPEATRYVTTISTPGGLQYCYCYTGKQGMTYDLAPLTIPNPDAQAYRYRANNSYQFNLLHSAAYAAIQVPFNNDITEDMHFDQLPLYDPPAFYNFEKTDSGYKTVTLSGIIAGDTASVLEKLIVDAIKKRDDLNLSCSAGGTFFMQTNGNFQLREEGIRFYFYQSASTWVLVPWTALQPYLRPGTFVEKIRKK